MWTELWNLMLSPRGTRAGQLTKVSLYWEEHGCVLKYVSKTKENYTVETAMPLASSHYKYYLISLKIDRQSQVE